MCVLYSLLQITTSPTLELGAFFTRTCLCGHKLSHDLGCPRPHHNSFLIITRNTCMQQLLALSSQITIDLYSSIHEVFVIGELLTKR
jgi:hypothetical protein